MVNFDSLKGTSFFFEVCSVLYFRIFRTAVTRIIDLFISVDSRRAEP